ncbi:hypothetical protein QAD02_005479 [Eretmocerus hayati]|uniref:Uncharacterized protein n=1 Tax=Eretmocerus hayati TaxID=131215 RepID=A0ACC2NVF4_9HYME|nr:hypothetical protein QAD02_005479 [Eretmocerus hayati]
MLVSLYLFTGLKYIFKFTQPYVTLLPAPTLRYRRYTDTPSTPPDGLIVDVGHRMLPDIVDAKGKREYGCGGSLITRWHVLTAAHCVTPEEIGPDRTLSLVRLGAWELKIDSDNDPVPYYIQHLHLGRRLQKYLDVPINRVFAHPRFTGESTDYQDDIALLQLAYPVHFTQSVRPICLPFHGSALGILTVVGWGETETGRRSEKLLQLKVETRDLLQCHYRYKELTGTNLNPNQICALGENDSDHCEGDSGGPLMEVDQWSPSQIYGIVSHRKGVCGGPGLPGIYTKVYNYLPWIADVLYRGLPETTRTEWEKE